MLSQVLFLALALKAAAAPTPAVDDSITVPLARRAALTNADGTANGPAILSNFNSTLKKYHAARVLPSYPGVTSLDTLIKRANSEPLTDQVEEGTDELYYGSVTVGAKEAQKFTADFDTGSSDFFVPGPNCGADEGCSESGTKYSQSGTDQGNTTSVTYGSGSISGENYFDTVTVAGLTATHQNVISLTQAEGFSSADSNSLLGMGFSTISNSGQPTFFENLINQGQVSVPEFSFYLGRAASGTQGDSQLTLGGRDTSKYSGEVTKVPVTTQGYWQVALDRVDVGGFEDPAGSLLTEGQAAIDTGTTIVLGPTTAVASIFARIPGSFPIPLITGSLETSLYAYPCNTTESIELVFAGTSFAISPVDLSLGQLTSGFADILGNSTLANLLPGITSPLCIAAIAGADFKPAEKLYIVGDTFLKSWYSIYNYENADGSPSVSFAKAAGN